MFLTFAAILQTHAFYLPRRVSIPIENLFSVDPIHHSATIQITKKNFLVVMLAIISLEPTVLTSPCQEGNEKRLAIFIQHI